MSEHHEGARLRALRERASLRQEDVAEQLDIDRHTVARMEKRGRGNNLRRYAELAGTWDAKDTAPRGQHNLPTEPSEESLYHRLLKLLSQPGMALDGIPMLNEERILLTMVQEQNLTPAQRFKILSAIFGLLAERLERTSDASNGQSLR